VRFALLAHFGKGGRPEPIIAKVSQETLAEMIGTTRSRASYYPLWVGGHQPSLMTTSDDNARRTLVYISDNDRLATVIVAIHPHIKSVV
jgi:hypothetical protein